MYNQQQKLIIINIRYIYCLNDSLITQSQECIYQMETEIYGQTGTVGKERRYWNKHHGKWYLLVELSLVGKELVRTTITDWPDW